MRRPRLHPRLPAALGAAAVVLASAVILAPTAARASTAAGAVISNGTVQLGVNALGDLNYDCTGNDDAVCPGDSAAPGGETSGRVGLRYQPDNLEAVADGSPAEGWGVADGQGDGDLTGHVNEDSGTENVTLTSFTSTGDTATSVVRVANGRASPKSVQVTQAYAQSASSKYLYADTVTITNTGQEAIGDLRYRRNVDWDIEPTAFNEWVTAGGSVDPPLLFDSDDGFASSDPLAGPSYDQSESVCGTGYAGGCSYTDLGAGGTYAAGVRQAADHGALYDYGLGALEVGASRTFTVFYGAAPDEATATAALTAVGARTYSLGESACTIDAVPDCEPTDPGGGDGGGDGGGGDGCVECARAGAVPAAEAPPDEPVGVGQGEPATFMLGFAVPTADVSVTQSADPDPVTVGQQLTYDLAVHNDGPDPASDVQVTDPLPDGVTLVSAVPTTGTCSSSDDTSTPPVTTVDCTLGTLAADATEHVRITVTPTQADVLSNTATVSTESYDPALDNNTDSVRTRVVPQLPVANDDSYTVDEDSSLTVAAPGVLANDTDPNGGTLFVTSDSPLEAPTHGTLTLDPNGDGGFTYTPAPGYSGTDTFTYTASNGEQTSTDDPAATVTITVTPPNHAPVAVGDAYTTDEDTALTVAAPGVLANDTDQDGDALTAALVSGPAHGTLALAADGGFVYTPAANYDGPDSFTYTATDGKSDPVQTTVSITVTPVPDPIVANDDSATTPRNTTLSVTEPGVLGNDSDPDGRASAVVVTGPAHGTLDLNTDGSYVYVPTTGYSGSDSFVYTAGDDSRATVGITVGEDEHAPVATEDGSYTGTEDTPLTVATPGVLANDTDSDGDTLFAVLVTGPSDGAVTLQSDGSFTYTPDANFNGDDSFTYRASDGTLTSDAATVRLHIDPVDDQPVATPDDYSTPEDTTLQVDAPGVLANDSDVDGDTLTAHLEDGPGHGTLTLDGEGGFTYVPNTGFVGTDSFTYRARTGETGTDPVTVTLHVTPVNHAPVAVPDSYTTSGDTTLTVALPGVLANDSDPDGNVLTAVLVSGPAHGTLTLQTNGRFGYTPDTGFSGTDGFRYRASDGVATSPSVRVTITVTAPATPPTTTPTTPAPSTPDSNAPVPPAGPTDTPVNTPTDTPPPTDGPTSDEPTDTPTTPSTPTSDPPSSSTPQRTLRLTAPSVIPGGALRAKGSGCAPGSAIQLTVAGHPAGTGQADGAGSFDLPVTTTGLGVGTYSVTATCGDRQLVSQVALVYVTANSTAPTAQALVVAAALAFFLLLLGLVLRRPTS